MAYRYTHTMTYPNLKKQRFYVATKIIKVLMRITRFCIFDKFCWAIIGDIMVHVMDCIMGFHVMSPFPTIILFAATLAGHHLPGWCSCPGPQARHGQLWTLNHKISGFTLDQYFKIGRCPSNKFYKSKLDTWASLIPKQRYWSKVRSAAPSAFRTARKVRWMTRKLVVLELTRRANLDGLPMKSSCIWTL